MVKPKLDEEIIRVDVIPEGMRDKPVAHDEHEDKVSEVDLLKAQLALRDERIGELERELAATVQQYLLAVEERDAELNRKVSATARIPLTEEQRANNERRRRREMMTQPTSRLVQLVMRTDGRAASFLSKMTRAQLIDLVIEGERRTTGRV